MSKRFIYQLEEKEVSDSILSNFVLEQQDNLDIGEQYALEEEMEKHLKKEESVKKFKAILFVMIGIHKYRRPR